MSEVVDRLDELKSAGGTNERGQPHDEGRTGRASGRENSMDRLAAGKRRRQEQRAQKPVNATAGETARAV